MSYIFEVVKRTRKSQDLLLTEVAITSQQNLDLIWDHGTVAGERLRIVAYGEINRCVSPNTKGIIASQAG